jgi:arsenate reductase-like glutaredoxin family protein
MMWRRLSDEVKAHIDEASAIQLMLETPSIIKRPVLDLGDRRVVGFKEADYETLFS